MNGLRSRNAGARRAGPRPGALHAARAALLLLATLACLPPAQAQNTQVLVSNIEQNYFNSTRLGTQSNSFDAAQSFTTGGGTYTLTSVELHLRIFSAGNNTTPTVKLLSGSATGTEVATLSGPSNLNTTQDEVRSNYTFMAGGTVNLSANTEYWVVVEGSSDNVFWGITSSTNEDSGGVSGFSIRDKGQRRDASETGAYSDLPGTFRAHMLRINGTIESEPNTPPTVANLIPDQTATAGTLFTYEVPANTFADADAGTTLTYRAELGDGTALPSWLTFTAATRTFTGTPPATAANTTLTVKVTASDSTDSVSDSFNITINAASGLPAAPAGHTTQVHNLDQVATGAGGLTIGPQTKRMAQVFRTGAGTNGFDLQSVEVAIEQPIPAADIGDLDVSIWTVNNSNEPDKRMFSLDKPTNTPSLGYSGGRFSGPIPVFNAQAGVTPLAGNTAYAVVLRFDNTVTKTIYGITASDSETSSTGFTIDDAGLESSDSGATWIANSNSKVLSMRVNAAPRGAAPALASPPAGHSAMLHNLTEDVFSTRISPSSTRRIAQVFNIGAATDTTGFNLQSVELAFAEGISPADISGLSVSIWSAHPSGHANAGQPNAKVDDLTNPAQVMRTGLSGAKLTSPLSVFNAPAGVTLDGGTLYALVISYNNTASLYAERAGQGVAAFTAGVTGSRVAGFHHFSTDGTTWTSRRADPVVMMRINGTARPAVNTAPTAADSTVSTAEDTDYTFTAADFNFADTDNDALASVGITSDPARGRGDLELSGTRISALNVVATVTRADIDSGNLKFRPVNGQFGDSHASFMFKVNDGTADSADAYTMTVNVTPDAQWSVLVSNQGETANTVTGLQVRGETTQLSQKFHTGDLNAGHRYRLRGASITLFESTSYGMRLRIYEENAGGTAAGTKLYDLNSPFPSGTTLPAGEELWFPAPANAVLDPDTNYYLVANRTSGPGAANYLVQYTNSTTDTMGSGETGWEINNTVHWQNSPRSGNIPLKMAIRGKQERIPNRPASGLPAITASNGFIVSSVLSADLSDIMDDDGVTNLASEDAGVNTATYVWKRFDSTGNTEENANIGTGASYTLTAADVGKTIKVQVSFSDDFGNVETPLTSLATVAISSAPVITITPARETYTAKVDWVNYTLTRTGDTAAELAVTVTLTPPASHDWQASEDVDDALVLEHEVTFAANESEAKLSVGLFKGIFGAIKLANTATVGGTLTASIGAVSSYDTSDTAEVNVLVFANPVLTASIEQSSLPAFTEGAGAQNVTVVLRANHAAMPAPSRRLDGTTTNVLGFSLLSAAVTDGATSGTDFDPLSETVTFDSATFSRDANGFMTARVQRPFTTKQDTVAEGDEEVTIRLSRSAGGLSSTVMSIDSNAGSFTVPIHDDDVGVSALALTSTPQLTSSGASSADTYGAGEDIEITMTLLGADAVVNTGGGVPYLQFTLGTATKQAAYNAARSAGNALVFTYEVQSTDTDTDGIFLLNTRSTDDNDANTHEDDALKLNGGTITSAVSGGAVNLVIATRGTQSGHKVDGSKTADNIDPVLDTTNNPPALAADGRTLTITYNEALKEASVPDASAYTVNAQYGGTGSAVAQALAEADMDAGVVPVAVAGSAVTLTLAKALLPGDTVTVSYDMPTGVDARIEDAAGNDAGSFTDQAVTNGATTVQVSVAALYDTAMSSGFAPPRFTVTRTGATTGDLEVILDIEQTEDYVQECTTDPVTSNVTCSAVDMPTFTITIPAGQSSMTEGITVAAFNDGTITATVGEGNGYAATRTAGENTATISVIDGNIDVAITETDYTVTEGENVTVNIRALGPEGVSALPARSFNVAILTEEATTSDLVGNQKLATIGVDYQHVSANPAFPHGDFSINSEGRFELVVPVTVTIVDDTLREPAPERFRIYIKSAQGVPNLVVPDRTRSHIIINDNGDTAAGVESVTVESTPISMSTYGRDEVILIGVTFTEPVTVTGSPQFRLNLGNGTPQAGFYDLANGNRQARFAYRVLSTDSSMNGIHWLSNSLTLNNGRIRSSESGSPVDVDIRHGVQGFPLSDHKVDGSINNNTAATGAVTISGTEEVGQTLTAVTSALADATDGLTSPVYRYQWLRVDGGADTEIAGATMSTYVVQGADLGKKLKVRVQFRDDKGYFEEKTSGETDEVDPPAETDPPVLAQTDPAVLAADGVTLTLTYNEALDENSEPSPSAFGLNVSGLTGVVQSVDVVGFTVVLTLAPNAVTSSRPVNNTDTVLLSYDKPNTNPIRDVAANPAGDLTDQAVDNRTISPPSAPRSVAAAPANASAGLSWDAPASNGGAPITGYQYRVSDDGGTTWNPEWTDVPDGPDPDLEPGNERAITVTGLTNGTAYRFEVRAYNGTRYSPAGHADATPQSGPARNPSAPLSLTATALDAGVELGWSAPADTGNRVITRYELRYARGGSVPSGTAWTDVGLSFSRTITGLENGRQYTFEVRALNSANLAGAVARQQATPLENAAAPGPVRELRAAVRNRAVLLSWRPPVRDGGMATITRYEVCYAAGDTVTPGAPATTCRDVEPDFTPYEVREAIGDLDNGVSYTFEVRALNSDNEKGAAMTVSAAPRSDTAPGTDTQPNVEPVPPLSAPRSLRAAAGEPYAQRGSQDVTLQTGYVDVTLSWAAPEHDGNSFGLTYEYRYAEGSSVPADTAWRATQIEGKELETVAGGLKTSTRYTFEVRARESSPAYGTEVEYGPAVRASLTTPRYSGPTMTLSVGSSVNEGQALTVTVTRSPATGAATAFVEINDKGAPDDDRFPNIVVDGETRRSTIRTVAVEFADGVSRASNTRYTPAYDGERDSNRELTVRIGAAQNDDVPGKTYSLDTRTRTVRVNDRDAGLRVDDDSVREAPGATLDFVVRLTRSRPWDVMVDYATSDGSSGSTLTATAASDYTPVADTLTIPAGATRATIRVTVLDDVVNDDGETLTLTLSNVRGGDRYIGDGVILEDATAVGTIRNTDPLPTAWLARFGRAAAVQVTDLLSDRFETAGNTPDRLTLGGRPVDVTALRDTLDDPSGLYRADTGGQSKNSGKIPTPAPSVRGDPGAGGQHNARGQSNITPDPAAGHDNEDVTLTPSIRNARGQSKISGEIPTPALAAGDQADPDVQAAQTREATLLERTLWTLLNSRGRVQFDTRQFLAQSSFDLSLTATDTGPDESIETLPAVPESQGRWSLWGRGAMTHFSGRDTGVNLSGDVLTGLIGLDYARDRWLAGTALAYHDGNGSYTSTRNPGAGDLDSTLITVNPYLRYAVNERLSAWGTAGYGTGTLALRQQHDSVPQETIETDLRLAMGAVGLRGVLYAGEATQLALKTDALWVRTASEATDGMQGTNADTSRLRLLLTGQHQRALANGALLSPNVELGIRYDDGDAETGFGMELGGGMRYADAVLGLSVETKARALIAHEDGQYQEWGLSGSVSLDPGRLGRGLALNLSSGWGAAESNAQAMWQRQTTAGIAPQQDLAAQARFTAEAGYGLDVPWTHAILTPYTGLEWAGQGRTLRLGWRYTLGQRLNVSLDGERRENGHTRPEHALMLRTSLPW